MGAKVKKILFSFLEVLLIILSLVVFLLVILPALCVIFLPMYLWRCIMVVYVKLFRKDIARIMGGKNPVLALDDINGRPLCTIVGMGAFDEGFNFKVANEYVVNIVNAVHPKTGEYLHKQLRQYYFEWCGFFWWRPVVDFNINDHIKIWNEEDTDKVITEEDFIQLVAELECRPFPKNKSPWEAVLIQNCLFKNVKNPDKPKFIYMFRFHHGLADGISVMQVFMQYVFDGSMEKVAKPAVIERNQCQKIFFKTFASLQLPYQFFKQGLSALDVNSWHLPENKLTRNIFKAWSPRIPISLIRDIKAQYRVGFTAVLVAVISGAMRKMMIKYNVPVPNKMHAILPLPWPKHPHKFCNHWSYGFVPLPVGSPGGRERLRKTQKYMEELKQSPSPYVNFAILKFFNLLPTWIMKRTTVTNYFPSVILSNFPGPPSESEGMGGFPLVDCMFTGGPLRGNIGISITILSYNGALRIVAGVDSAIFPTQQMANELIEIIQQEFLALKDEEMV